MPDDHINVSAINKKTIITKPTHTTSGMGRRDGLFFWSIIQILLIVFPQNCASLRMIN